MMATLTITTSYDGHVSLVAPNVYTKITNTEDIYVGTFIIDTKITVYYRAFFKFLLTDLPAGSTVSQVRTKVNCNTAGGAAHLTDIHAYGTAGQEDPQVDDAATCYGRMASGTLYVNDSTALRTTGEKWFDLGAQACLDVEAAKAAVNRFSLGFHEEGDNDAAAYLDALEKSGGIPVVLEITYTPPPPAVWGGSTLPQVAVAKAILEVLA